MPFVLLILEDRRLISGILRLSLTRGRQAFAVSSGFWRIPLQILRWGMTGAPGGVFSGGGVGHLLSEVRFSHLRELLF